MRLIIVSFLLLLFSKNGHYLYPVHLGSGPTIPSELIYSDALDCIYRLIKSYLEGIPGTEQIQQSGKDPDISFPESNSELTSHSGRQNIQKFVTGGLAVIFTVLFYFIYVRQRRKEKSMLTILHRNNSEMVKIRNQLVAQEKLTLLGQVAAGIAHEVKTPMNFVNNFAISSLDLTKELLEILEKQYFPLNVLYSSEVQKIIEDLEKNSIAITRNGQRVNRIVHQIIQHASGTRGKVHLTDLHTLINDHLKLAFFSYRVIDPSFDLKIEEEYDPAIGLVEAVPEDLGRVLLNIIINACFALNQKRQKSASDFTPTLTISTRNRVGQVEISIQDNGPGIPIEIREKIFHPFFTTKSAEEGHLGLGLSICRDIIVNGHNGVLEVDSEPETFTKFIIRISSQKTLCTSASSLPDPD